MDCIANPPRKSRLSRLFVLALFVSCLALQSGFSEAASITPETSTVATPKVQQIGARPFSKIAVAVTLGLYGPGLQVATPLSRSTNLRVDGSFFQYGLSLTQNNVQYNANLNIREVRVTYDYFPFHGGFRISGGVVAYNKFDISGNGILPSGQNITLNGVEYYSAGGNSALQANANVFYGKKVAPAATFGWGNIIPRSGRHISIPFEFGAAYTGVPTFNLAAQGDACLDQTLTTCYSVTDPNSPINTVGQFQSNLAAQIGKIRKDLEPAKFYPILNLGVAYRF